MHFFLAIAQTISFFQLFSSIMIIIIQAQYNAVLTSHLLILKDSEAEFQLQPVLYAQFYKPWQTYNLFHHFQTSSKAIITLQSSNHVSKSVKLNNLQVAIT